MPRGIYNRNKKTGTGKTRVASKPEPNISTAINGQKINFELDESEGHIIRSVLEKEFKVVSKRYTELKRLMERLPID